VLVPWALVKDNQYAAERPDVEVDDLIPIDQPTP
jgi:hypothetical protein